MTHARPKVSYHAVCLWGISTLTLAENSPGADFLALHRVRFKKKKKWNKELKLPRTKLSHSGSSLPHATQAFFFLNCCNTRPVLPHPNKTNLIRLRKRLMMPEKSDHFICHTAPNPPLPLRSFGFEIHEAPCVLTWRRRHVTLCTVYLPHSPGPKVMLHLREAIFSIHVWKDIFGCMVLVVVHDEK